MKSNEFAYWLQGYFELRGPDAAHPLDETQWGVVRNHIELVKAVAKKQKKGVSKLILWVDTALDLAKEAKLPSAMLTTLVHRRVADQFKHVIDPKSYGKDLEPMLDIHDGKTVEKPAKPRFAPLTSYPSGGGGFGGHSNTRYGC